VLTCTALVNVKTKGCWFDDIYWVMVYGRTEEHSLLLESATHVDTAITEEVNLILVEESLSEENAQIEAVIGVWNCLFRKNQKSRWKKTRTLGLHIYL